MEGSLVAGICILVIGLIVILCIVKIQQATEEMLSELKSIRERTEKIEKRLDDMNK